MNIPATIAMLLAIGAVAAAKADEVCVVELKNGKLVRSGSCKDQDNMGVVNRLRESVNKKQASLKSPTTDVASTPHVTKTTDVSTTPAVTTNPATKPATAPHVTTTSDDTSTPDATTISDVTSTADATAMPDVTHDVQTTATEDKDGSVKTTLAEVESLPAPTVETTGILGEEACEAVTGCPGNEDWYDTSSGVKIGEASCHVKHGSSCIFGIFRPGLSTVYNGTLCSNQGALPANVYTQQHHEHLAEYVRCFYRNCHWRDRRMWIGMRWNNAENRTTFFNGTEATYTYWDAGFPDGPSAGMVLRTNDEENVLLGFHNTAPTTQVTGILCEYTMDEKHMTLPHTEEYQSTTDNYVTPGQSCSYETCEDTTITSSEITASSEFRGPWCALEKISLESSSAWCAARNDENQWVQWDFKRPIRIKGIVTQGNRASNEWVKTYKVSYGNDTSRLQIYQTSDGEMVFSGNNDRETRVENLLPAVVTARYFRILPQTWHMWISMRSELLLSCCE